MTRYEYYQKLINDATTKALNTKGNKKYRIKYDLLVKTKIYRKLMNKLTVEQAQEEI